MPTDTLVRDWERVQAGNPPPWWPEYLRVRRDGIWQAGRRDDHRPNNVGWWRVHIHHAADIHFTARVRWLWKQGWTVVKMGNCWYASNGAILPLGPLKSTTDDEALQEACEMCEKAQKP